jgi:kynurenine 3-monooxygenase
MLTVPRRNYVDRFNYLYSSLSVGIIILLHAIMLSFLTLPTTSMVVTESSTAIRSTYVTQSSSSSSSSAISQNKNCIIVGGGPIGLATALTLARAPHSYNITLLEATSDLTSVYDPSKSYLYNVNARGLEWFVNPTIAPQSAYERLQQMGYSPGVGSMGTFYAVPANPLQAIPNAKQLTMMSKTQSSKKVGSKPMPSPKPSYWIPRHQLNEILYDCCNEHNANHNDTKTTIRVFSGKPVGNIYPSTDDENLIAVHCQDGDIYTGALIVAADGINSVVRSSLAGLLSHTPSHHYHPSSSWLQSNKKSFRVRKFQTPATGLKFKALQFKPKLIIQNSTVSDTNGDCDTPLQYFTPISTDIVSLRGRNTGFRNRLSLGFLPMKDPNMIRLGNTIAPYDHEIWSLRNGTEAKHWFMRTFPRLLWNESIIHEDEWDRYVQTRATTFPLCQYSPGSAVASPNGLCGVVMVGDSCKLCFVFSSAHFPLLIYCYNFVAN